VSAVDAALDETAADEQAAMARQGPDADALIPRIVERAAGPRDLRSIMR
jgi:hypothetical protein